MATLEQLMAEAGLAGPENELLKAQYLDALKRSRTPQPGLIESRGMNVAASPLANVASTLDQIFGGRDSGALMQAMSANLKKQQAGRSGLAEAATQPGANLDQMQIMAGAGGDATGSMGTTLGQVEARGLKAALAAAQRDNQQKLLDKSLSLKLTMGQMEEEGKDRRFMPYEGGGTPSSGTRTLNKQTGGLTTTAPVLNPNRPAQVGIDPEDPKEIALAIKEGRRSPVLNRMYKYAGPVAAALAKDHDYNHAIAENEWGAMQKFVASANSSQQLRMRQSIDFAYHSLQNIESIYDKWKKVGAATGFKVLNRASLAAAKNMPGEAGATAQALEASINDMIEALGNVYMGGNTPTDQAFKLAGENLKSDWNPETFEAGLKLARTNLRYRNNAMKTAGPVGTGSSPNRYAPTETEPAAAPAPATSGDRVPMWDPATGTFK